MKLSFAFAILITAVPGRTESTLLWKNPGPIEKLDLAVGPGGPGLEPVPPFRFVSEETRGISPKVVVLDAKGKKWMVKFGEEAKPETFASRISWAAGYPVRPSYYLAKGNLEGVTSLKHAGTFLDTNGVFRQARFQMFDTDSFREVPGIMLDLNQKRKDQRELNGLKLTLLLVANWDVKTENTGVYEIKGQRYAAVSDWGASMGDPASFDPAKRKWNCAAYSERTQHLVEGVENGYVQFNYGQYASRHEYALSQGIKVEHLAWFLTRMQRLTDRQVRKALQASGATPVEAGCFTKAVRERLKVFASAGKPSNSEGIPARTVTTTTTTTTTISK